MEKIKIKSNKDLFEVIKLIKEAKDSDILVVFDKKTDLYTNSSNLKVLKALAKDSQKDIKFDVENEKHKDYIDAINNDVLEFDDSQIDLDEGISTKDPDKKNFDFSVLRKSGTLSNEKKKPSLKKSFFVVFITSLLVAGLFFIFWWFIPTANVKITVDSEVLVKLLNITAVSGQKEIDAQKSTIPAFLLEASESDFQTNPTTGEKEVGDFAKGKVTIYNKTSDDLKIEKGTVVKLISTEDESLKYKTTEEAIVNARTEAVGTSEVTYGTKEVEVNAYAIGDKYNIKEGQNFEIAGYNTDKLVGKNNARIEGGSSAIVNIVTQSDLNSLKASLEEFIRKKVFNSLTKKTVKGQKLLESSVRTTVNSAIFDKGVGDDASDVTLTMTVTATGLAYSENDLDQIVAELIKDIVPESYRLDEENPEYEVAVSNVSTDSKELSLQVKLRSHISPKFDEAQIVKNLTGMKIAQAKEYLGSINTVKGYEIIMSPKLPPIIQTMPRRPENITIEIVR